MKRTSWPHVILLLAAVGAASGWALAPELDAAPQTPPAQGSAQAQGPDDPALAALVKALAEQGIRLEPKESALWFPVRVEVRDELLEYFLVGPAGASHESLFSTGVQASVLHTAFLALGLTPGRNANWQPKDPRPSEEELRAGVAPYEVEVPKGDGIELYVAWKQADETYFFRAEDLLRNLLTGASMQRHQWVYLGSRMLPADPRAAQGTEQFAADVYQNLINISYFREGYTLLTAALPECVEQTIWLPNAWHLPQRGTEVALIASRQRLERCPDSIAAQLPKVDSAARDSRRHDAAPPPGPPRRGQ